MEAELSSTGNMLRNPKKIVEADANSEGTDPKAYLGPTEAERYRELAKQLARENTQQLPVLH